MTSPLQDLGQRLVGSWTTSATHPLLPGEVVTGTSDVEWLAGGPFLLQRVHQEHPDFPDALWVLGDTTMHYFDTRGVHRLFDVTVSDDSFSLVRGKGEEQFAQRMSFNVDEGGAEVHGTSQLCHDGVTWVDDLQVVYRRAA